MVCDVCVCVCFVVSQRKCYRVCSAVMMSTYHSVCPFVGRLVFGGRSGFYHGLPGTECFVQTLGSENHPNC